jgi:hypothetical protein
VELWPHVRETPHSTSARLRNRTRESLMQLESNQGKHAVHAMVCSSTCLVGSTVMHMCYCCKHTNNLAYDSTVSTEIKCHMLLHALPAHRAHAVCSAR